MQEGNSATTCIEKSASANLAQVWVHLKAASMAVARRAQSRSPKPVGLLSSMALMAVLLYGVGSPALKDNRRRSDYPQLSERTRRSHKARSMQDT
jgi:serine/threonine-protein kinase RIO1